MKVLVTGSAGFIGYHLTRALLNKDFSVIGVDNLNSYYDTNLKNERLKELSNFSKKRNLQNNYKFFEKDICDYESLKEIFFKSVRNGSLKAQEILLTSKLYSSLMWS